MTIDSLLSLFHHIHHLDDGHKVHHCGGEHRQIDPSVNYTIEHCSCGKHRIDQSSAIGHATNHDGAPLTVNVIFKETCPQGGWHVESGCLVA